jgi:hypothetical protein
MVNNTVAYVGIECFDLILYQARILSKLGRKVLIMENGDTGAFYYTIPRPFGTEKLINPVSYRHVDFAVMSLPEDMKKEYDDIFISYGFHNPKDECDKIIFSTDLHLHHMKMINDMYMQNKCMNKSLLIRNVIDVNVNAKYVFRQLGENIDINFIDFDEIDYGNAILCQHYQTMGFCGLSKKARDYLLKEVRSLCPDIGNKTLFNAYKAAQRGNW